MRNVIAIFKREMQGYFVTPLGYVFLAIFLFLSGIFTFGRGLGSFYEIRQANLRAFFYWHPWLYLFLVPAVSMRLWAEERKSGTIELLLTLPVSICQAVVGKFLAAWCFLGIALALTFPMVITVNVLGDPDQGVIVASYLASFMMAGAYLAVGSCISALTKNQVISFVISLVICFMFLVNGLPVVTDWLTGWAPDWLALTVTSMSFHSHFESIQRGVFNLVDLVFYVSMSTAWIYMCTLILDAKKAS